MTDLPKIRVAFAFEPSRVSVSLDAGLALAGHSGGGMDGASAYELALARGFVGTLDEWLASLGGTPGDDGASAYDLAVAAGFVGTPAEWLASLNGAPGGAGASVSVLTFEAAQQAQFDAAVAANAADPRVLVLRYAGA